MWTGYKNYDHHFNMQQIEEFFSEVRSNKLDIVGTKVKYYNIPASFDIETSSCYTDDGEKIAFMYLWAFGLNGSVIVGRTWQEFSDLTWQVTMKLALNEKKRLLVYVHNLGYEFQFMRKRISLEENSVFSVKKRKPIYALTKNGIEYRCSYILSNYSLAAIGESQISKYHVTKKVGDLDYSLVRTPITPITDKEMQYQTDDVRVVMSYIQEKIEHDGDITKLPLTNTGYVRILCREWCLNKNNKKSLCDYRLLMNDLRIVSGKEYSQLKSAFAGGFVHANPYYANRMVISIADNLPLPDNTESIIFVRGNIDSDDETSAYPAAMCFLYYPMSMGRFIGRVNSEDVHKYLNKYCCLFTVRIKGMYSKIFYDSYISASKCSLLSDDAVINNGRIVSASEVQLNITELDFDIIDKVYGWDEIEFFNFRIYDRAYLPKPLIMAILHMYANKTSLKGVTGREVEYMVFKNMINAAFGMAVTDIVRDEIIYDENDNWSKDDADAASQLISYNNSFTRFLSYAWGVWVTAHGRHNLWEAIFELKNDYIYADTDSVKGVNFDKHQNFFDSYNLGMTFKAIKMCSYYNIPLEMTAPKTIKGVEKQLGIWDKEEPYLIFKTLGAKRYMYEYADHKFGMTVAGVRKNYAIPFLLNQYGGEKYKTKKWYQIFFDAYNAKGEVAKKAMDTIIEERVNGDLSYENVIRNFTSSLFIPAGHSGKQTLTYIDEKRSADVKDYLGIECHVSELSAIHMEPAAYYFNITKEYMDFINGHRDCSE